MTDKIFAIVLVMLLAVSCQSQTSDASNTNDTKTSNSQTARLAEPCAEWDREYALLPNEQKRNLAEYGIAQSEGDPASRTTYFVLSPSLEPDCALRLDMAAFLNSVPGGEASQADVAFARQHSKKIGKVLKAVWDTPPFMFDGAASSETYRFLINKGMKDEDVRPLIGHLLETEELHAGLVYTIIVRPLPMLRPTLEKLAKKYEDAGDLPDQTFILLGLAQIAPGKNPAVLSKLERIARSRKLSPEGRKTLEKAVDKRRSGHRLECDNIDKLGLPLSDG